jgi:hypothetical protein
MNYPFSGLLVRFSSLTEGTEQANGDPEQSVAPSPVTPSTREGGEVVAAVPDNQIHANLWEIGDRRFLDIGVMIDGSESGVKEIAVELPWVVQAGEVFDLGTKLDGDKILTAIFNEVVSYSGISGSDYATVTIDPENKGGSKFVIVRLHSFSFKLTTINLPNRVRTTRLVITVPSDERTHGFRRYIRFRIVDIPLGVYTAIFAPNDRTLLSSSVQTRIFDFRINVRRGIPDDVLAGAEQWRFPRFSKIHLFAILAREREIAFEGDTFKACRSLEDEDVWNSYVNLSETSDESFKAVRNYLGYQWTASSKQDGSKDLVALARFTSVNASGANIVRFLVLGLLLGALAGGLWDLMKWFFENRFAAYASFTKDEVRPDAHYHDFPLLAAIVGVIVLLVIASPKRIVALYETCKRGAKRLLRFIGGLLIEK